VKLKRRILVVVRWPLGGIRTYMRYMFSHFPPSYNLMVLAASTQEDKALTKDTEGYEADLKLVQVIDVRALALEVFKELRRNRYDLILSQGFVSAVAVYMANLFHRIPHMLTIHGIVEPQYLGGRFGFVKKMALAKILSGVTVLYGVSNDILAHLFVQFPKLNNKGPQTVVIPNGVEPSEFEQLTTMPMNVRDALGVDPSVFLFGFFGRFMAQKGFDLLIEAVDSLTRQDTGNSFAVVAVGSGDYLLEYQAIIKKKGLEAFFYFLPFQPQVHQLYPQVEAIIMPSRWEASGLLAMEGLCMGTPLIASGCVGLRETIADTPTFVFPSENVGRLADLMLACLQNRNSEVFKQFMSVARTRFDVANSAEKLTEFIENMLDRK